MKLHFLFTLLFVTALAHEVFEAIEPDSEGSHPLRSGGVEEPLSFLEEDEDMLPSNRALASLPKDVSRCARRCIKTCSKEVPPRANRTRWQRPAVRRELNNCTRSFVTTKCRSLTKPKKNQARNKCRRGLPNVTACDGDRLCSDNFCVASGICCADETKCTDGSCVVNATHCHNTSSTTTRAPTRAPTTSNSTHAPTKPPTHAPTKTPTHSPTKPPTHSPFEVPTASELTHTPTKRPTRAPTKQPTHTPTKKPTHTPTKKPTYAPTKKPTYAPTQKPTNRLRCRGDGHPCQGNQRCCSGVCGANHRCVGN